MLRRLSPSKSPGLHYLLWKLGFASAKTQTTLAEQVCLERYAADRRRLLELGVWHGVTTRRLCSVMAKEGVLFAVDPFPPGRLGWSFERAIAHGEAARVSKGRVKFLEMTSLEAANLFAERGEQPLDFIFIDADHSFDAVRQDWQLWSSWVSEQGVILLHDSRSHEGRSIDDGGPARVVREIISYNRNFEPLDAVDSITVWRRIP